MLRIYDVDTARKTILRREVEDLQGARLEGLSDNFGRGVTPNEAVAQILASVRKEGDRALKRWSRILDDVQLDELRLPLSAISNAFRVLPDSLAKALEAAANRIRAFHELQPLPNWDYRVSWRAARATAHTHPPHRRLCPGGIRASTQLLADVGNSCPGSRCRRNRGLYTAPTSRDHPSRRTPMRNRNPFPGRRRAGYCRHELRHREHPSSG